MVNIADQLEPIPLLVLLKKMAATQIATTPSKIIKSAKELAESTNLSNSIPTNYAYFADDQASDVVTDLQHSIPIIDLSLLQSGTPDQRSKAIQDLGKACQDWGFFMVVNHGLPESLTKAMIDKCDEFFNLPVEEKQEFEHQEMFGLSNPIKYGTSFNTSIEEVHFWRDFLKLVVHPQFNCPPKPHGLSELSLEYSKQIRRVASVLLRGISTSLGLNEDAIEKAMDLESSQQNLLANYYPPCPRPDLAIGLPPHTDHGLLTLLTQNQDGALQIYHNEKWVQISALPNSILVNTADQLEIFSNGKYKSIHHRAMVNNKVARISLVITNGPSPDTVVKPSADLLKDGTPAKYKGSLTYRESVELHLSRRLSGQNCKDVFETGQH